MNLLEQAIRSYRLDEVSTMNPLQLVGVVSDNCITAADVAPADCERAVGAVEYAVFLLDIAAVKDGAHRVTRPTT